jgi:cell division protein FtsQ
MRRRPVLSPRDASAALEDLASRRRLIGRQRVDRYRLRRRVARRARWVAWRVAVVALALGSVGACAVGARWLLGSPRFAVASVEVTGHSRLSRDEIETAAGLEPGINLFKVDPHAVEARLQQLAVIRRANVVRALPNRVSITVEERRPFALVHADGLHWVDDEGVALGPEPRPVALGLPVISGVEAAELQPGPREPSGRLATGLALLRVLLRSGGGLVPSISEIDVSRGEGPVLYTVDAVEVRLGKEEWEARLGRLAGVLAQLRSSGAVVSSIDLRFRDKVVLKNRAR